MPTVCIINMIRILLLLIIIIVKDVIDFLP